MPRVFVTISWITVNNFNLIYTIQILPAIIIGLTFHEFSHAYIAYLCGDYTAKDLGRLSLNPIKHIDPLGFILIIFAWFWWAKPVTFNEYNLKNKDTDIIKIAVAWPLSNALLAIVFSGIFVFIANTISEASFDSYNFFIEMVYYGIFINWGLFIFNLIPIPPLDGSHVFLNSCKNHPGYASLQKWWTIGLFAILILESQTGLDILPISPVINYLGEWSLKIFGYQ